MDLNLSIPSKLYSKSYFHAVHILADFKKTRIMQKHVQHENFFIHSILPHAVKYFQTYVELSIEDRIPKHHMLENCSQNMAI